MSILLLRLFLEVFSGWLTLGTDKGENIQLQKVGMAPGNEMVDALSPHWRYLLNKPGLLPFEVSAITAWDFEWFHTL